MQLSWPGKSANTYKKLIRIKLVRDMYAHNLQVFIDKITAADQQNAQLLASVQDKPFFVFP